MTRSGFGLLFGRVSRLRQQDVRAPWREGLRALHGRAAAHERQPVESTAGKSALTAWHAILRQQRHRWSESGGLVPTRAASSSQAIGRSVPQRGFRAGGAAARPSTAEGAGDASGSASKALPAFAGGGPSAARPIRSGPVTWGSLLLLLITGAGLVYYFDTEKRRRLKDVTKDRSVGKAAIGGPFELVDQDGKKVTQADFVGGWNLIYFGFTYCPDICPQELEKMAKAIDAIEKKAKVTVRPIFISVDPERDTPEQVRQYVTEFHPRLVGLTGSPHAVQEVARSYRVYYMKTEEEGNDYLVDHSIIMYLMDPNMGFVKFFGKNNDVDQLSEGIMEEIRKWKP